MIIMDVKAAAIALTIIVALPLLLGYALSFEEVERTGWQSDNQINATDMILNNQSPYYSTSYSPGNNMEILAKLTYPGIGVSETKILSPNYAVKGTTYTSLPEYGEQTGTITWANVVTNVTTGIHEDNFSYVIYGNGIATGQAYYYFEATELSQIEKSNGQYDLDTAWGPMLQSSADTWTGDSSMGRTITIDTGVGIYSDRYPTYTIKSRAYTDVDLNYDYSFSCGSAAAIKLTKVDNSVQYIPYTSNNTITITKAGNTVLINNNTYTNVKLVSVAPTLGLASSTYTYTAPTGQYADPAYGWTLPTPGAGATMDAFWMNGQVNKSVRILATVEAGESVTLAAVNNNVYSNWVQITTGSNNIYVNGTNLGAYRNICIDVGTDKTVVSGIVSWPTMGTDPQLINSVTVDYTGDIGQFAEINISAIGPVNFRVDRAEILAGTFPDTLNKTLDLSGYWPNRNFAISPTSIGIYGDYIQFGGETFTVDGNKITVDGQTVNLLKAVFTTILNTSTNEYENTINNITVSSTASPATIKFGGEWSLTIAAYTLESVTGTNLEWQPGVFSFDAMDNDFAIAGLLASIVAFVAVGMYGRRSGAKIGLLMLICGSSALIFLMLL